MKILFHVANGAITFPTTQRQDGLNRETNSPAVATAGKRDKPWNFFIHILVTFFFHTVTVL